MVDVNNSTVVPNDDLATTTDGYPGTSAHTYQMHLVQNITTDEYWLHYNTTDVYQFYQNMTIDGTTTKDGITREEHLTTALILGMITWILSPFILICNGLTIVVVLKYIKKITATHVAIAFLAFAGLFVGILPVFRLTLYLMGDSVYSKYINDLNGWVTTTARTLSVSAIL